MGDKSKFLVAPHIDSFNYFLNSWRPLFLKYQKRPFRIPSLNEFIKCLIIFQYANIIYKIYSTHI